MPTGDASLAKVKDGAMEQIGNVKDQVEGVVPGMTEPQLLDIMIVQFRNEKVSNHGSIPRSPLTVTLWPSSFLKKDSTSP
ncbi:hypothetical protein TNCV_873261 [Trichonephila clavipes]|nr:hypothetical protein TNCV_873261 [Trichonephila clavipes]